MTKLRSSNGWPVIPTITDPRIHQWSIPTHQGEVVLPLRRGPAGFLLSHFTLWFSASIEPVFGKGDDFGWANRAIAGSIIKSNHASGTAGDLNSSLHPSGKAHTFNAGQILRIHTRLEEMYRGVIRWGGDYIHAPVDEMHFEINATPKDVQSIAHNLKDSWRGVLILEANPDQVERI